MAEKGEGNNKYDNASSIAVCCLYKSVAFFGFHHWLATLDNSATVIVSGQLSVHVWLQRVTMKKEESKVSPNSLIIINLAELCF